MIDNKELTEIIQKTVNDTLTLLSEKNMLGNGSNVGNPKPQSERTAYQQTEQLLYNLNGFKKIVKERMKEIEDIRKYGVPKKSKSITQFCGSGGSVNSSVQTEEESVEAAVQAIEASVQGTVQAISLIEKSMHALRYDPYYKILEMRYLEGRTQEDIALEFNCTQQNISYHRSRLVKELAMRLFPDKVMNEYMK